MLNGEWVIAYIWWEGKDGWNEVLETNTWPPDTETTTAWKVRNTGDEAAFFGVRFMDLRSAGVLLNPGGEAWLYLYPVTPSAGIYNYTLDIIADNTVVRVYPVAVITGVPPEPVEGTIIRKELEYSGSGDGIVPVANVPQGVSAKLHVWGLNKMSIPQGMGIYWFVADKDAEIAEEYEDWGGTIGAYPTDHEFISSGSFTLNKVGKYTTWIELLMGSQDNPEIVDRYIGDLCTVVAELVPTFSELSISSFSKK